MADNTTLNPGTGGDVIASDDVGGVKYQVVKLAVGADGAAALVANANPIPVSDAGGALTVDGTVGVSGTVTVDGSGVTQPVSHAALTELAAAIDTELQVDVVGALPAGTNNIGDVDVLTLPALPAGTNNIGDVDVLTIAAGDNNIGNVDIVTMPNVTLAAGTNTNEVVGDVAQDAAVAGNPVLVGLRASTATPSAMSADGDSVYAWADRNGAQVVVGNVLDDAAFTPGTNRVTPVGYLADETATDSVDEGDVGAGRITLDRKQIITPYVHAAAGGWTPHKNLDVDETEDDIKTSPGKLGWIHVMNRSTGVRYIKFFNATAANVTVGSTTPVLSFPVPTMADTNGAGFCISFGDAGVQFDTAISVAATTGVADADTGAPGTNDVVLNAGFI